MKFLKNASSNFWLNAVAIVFTLVGTILLISTSATPGYSIPSSGLGIAFAVLAIIFAGGSIALARKFGETHPIPSVLGLAALIFNVIAIAVIILGRANLAASLLTFDSYNSIGWSVFAVSISALIFFLLADIALIVGAFLSRKSDKHAE